MAGTTKLMTAGGGGVSLTPASSIASDVTVNVPVTGVNNGTLVCSDSSGNVGIGTSSPAAKLQVETNASGGDLAVIAASKTGLGYTVSLGYYASAGTATAGIVRAGNGLPLAFDTSSAERMRIDSSGNLLVGTTSATNGSRCLIKGSGTSSSTWGHIVQNSAATWNFGVRDDGAMWIYGMYGQTTANAANLFAAGDGYMYRSTSSIKYKTDVQDATHGLKDVLKLRPVTYKGKSPTDGDKVFGGLVAEEVHEAGLTEFVQYAEDGSPDALAYGNMVSLCVKAIQELSAKNDALEARIAALEAK